MPDDDAPVRIYEGSSLTVKGEVIAKHAELVEEVTFKFFQDGAESEAKTVPMTDGVKDAQTGNVVVTHTFEAPDVADDKEKYVLDYHVFYKVKHKDGTSESHEDLAVRSFEVLPRTAQLAVTHVKDGKPIPSFQFKVFQGGEQIGGLRSTFADDTPNAKGETVPAGTAEFNLALVPGFRIVQASPYEIAEETVTTGRKRKLKGELKFRAVFVAPKRGTYKQMVNLASVDEGRGGSGKQVTIYVAPEGDEDRAVKVGNESTEIHFRVTFGPETGEVLKSARDDDTKVSGPPSVTIEEKTAKKKYQGKLTLGGGIGTFDVALGAAGGDSCLIEIGGSDKFFTDASVPADQTIRIENWRRVFYEALVPDVIASRVLAPLGGLSDASKNGLESLGRQLFIDFEPEGATVFDAMTSAAEGTLLRARFLELPGPADAVAYVLAGRNWRELPHGQGFKDLHPGKSLFLLPCSALMKWRKDTAEPQAAPKDYSGTLTAPAGSIEMEATFGGLFMPFSADDGGDGITDLVWTADISKTEGCVKHTPALTVTDRRDISLTLVTLTADELSATPAKVRFVKRGDGKFDPALSKDAIAEIQTFIDGLLIDHRALVLVGSKVKITVAGPTDSGNEEDACFAAAKKKLTELFDATKKEFVYHPGLDGKGEPRTAPIALADLSDGDKSTMKTWHYALAEELPDGSIGPGAFVGAAKTATECPIKLEMSVQPHKSEMGASDGHLVAWAVDPALGAKNLTRHVLQAFGAIVDKAAVKHGHGADGKPGDCLAAADVLCADCVAFGRSVSLELIP